MVKISTKNIAYATLDYLIGKSGADLENAYKEVVKFLNKKKLISKSGEILKELEKVIDEKDGVVRIKIKSAKDIPENKKKEIEEDIKNKYKMKGVRSEYVTDERLLGGIRIEVGEEILDNTYRNKLNQLAEILISK